MSNMRNTQDIKDTKDIKATKDWETTTYAGLMFSLRKYRDRLEGKRGFKLNAKPREIDVRIIDKLSGSDDRINNAIGYIFEKHNLVELKNPNEELNIDVVWKGISYAAQYKSSGYDDFSGDKGLDVVSIDDVTLTFLRLSKPDNLFKVLEARGYSIESKFPGVYYIKGMVDIKMQVVVGRELVGTEYTTLRVQKSNASNEDVREFMRFTDGLKDAADREMAEAIMQISFSENKETYEALREELDMNEMIRELYKDEIDAAVKNAVITTRDTTRNSTQEDMAVKMIRKGMSEDDIVDVTDLGVDKIRELYNNVKEEMLV